MRRWIWKILLAALVMAALTGSAMAAEVTVGGVKYDTATGTVLGPANKESITTAKILSEVDGAKITKITDGAFEGCKKLTTVEIASGIKTVGKAAFNGCTQLRNVYFPSSVETIEENAFAACSSLRSVALPESLSTIEFGTFMACTSLTNVYIPKNVSTVKENAFLLAINVKILHYGGSSTGLKQEGDEDKKLTVHTAVPRSEEGSEPTCTTEGKERVDYLCGDCKVFYTEEKSIPANGHTPGAEIPENPATCSQTGTTAGRRCTVCNAIVEGLETIEIDKTAHGPNEEIPRVEPTCTEAGSEGGKRCSLCKAELTAPTAVAALGHEFEPGSEKTEITTKPTCTEEGTETTTKHCNRCGQDIVTEENPVPATGHTFNAKTTTRVIATATCKHKGITVTYRVCDVCGKSEYEGCDTCKEIEEKLKTPAAELEASDLAHLESHGDVDETEPLKHTLPAPTEKNIDASQSEDATCTSEGKRVYNTGTKCTVCGTELSGDDLTVILPKLEHTAGTPVEVVTPPDCTTPGRITVTVTCTVCDAIIPDECKDDPIAAPGHTWGNFTSTTTVKEPTCVEGKALGTAKCEVCGEVATDIEITLEPVADHQYGEWTDAEEEGKQIRVCSVCGDTKTRENPNGTTSPEDPDDDTTNPSNPSNPSTPSNPSNPSTPSDSSHNINIISSSNGSVSPSVYSAKRGDLVTLTVRPDSGYELDWVRVTTSSGAIRTLDGLGSGQYRFTMPDAAVDVRASFTRTYTPSWSSGSSSASSGATSRWTDPAQTVVQGVPRASASSQLFSDIPLSHWAAGEINWANQMGYMNGSGGRFRPDGTITFQQMWMVLARISGSRPANMEEARNWAVLNGFAEGGNPGHTVARHQLVTALYRCAHIMGSTNQLMASLADYPDSRTVPTVARDPMAWAVANGILGGNANGRLDPYGTLTRAQFAVILYRFSQRI